MTLRRLFPLILCLVTSMLVSCNSDEAEDDVIYDFQPVIVTFDIQNLDGKSRLQPDSEGCVADSDIKLIYKNQEYAVRQIPPSPETGRISRMYLAHFYGLYYNRYDQNASAGQSLLLNVGEFDGAENLDETFTIRHDGKEDEFHIIHRVQWKGDTPHTITKLYLNGSEIQYGETAILRI